MRCKGMHIYLVHTKHSEYINVISLIKQGPHLFHFASLVPDMCLAHRLSAQ